MIKQEFNKKNFWRYGIAFSAVTMLTACGSQTLVEEPKSTTTTSYSTSSQHTLETDGGYSQTDTGDTDELINYGLNTATSAEDTGAAPTTTANDSAHEEDDDMTVLVIDEAVAAALDAQVKNKSGYGSSLETTTENLMTIDPPQPRVLFYGFDQAVLTPEQQADIRMHADFLAVHPNYQIQIHGHSDKQGHPGYNERLAKERAQKVADALIQAGVNKDQVEVFAWGSRDPLLSASQHDKNRRVEMIYLSDQVAMHDDAGSNHQVSSATIIE